MERWDFTLFTSFSGYFANFVAQGYQNLWSMLLILLLYYTLILLIKRLLRHELTSEAFQIWQSMLLATLIILFLLVVFTASVWANSKIIEIKHLEFLLLLYITLFSTGTLCGFIRFRNKFKPMNRHQILPRALTKNEFDHSLKIAKNHFKALKWALLLIVLGLSAGWITFSRPARLIAIAIDNSQDQTESLQLTQQTLTPVLTKMAPGNDLILSWSTPKFNDVQILDTLMLAKNYEYLNAEHAFIENQSAIPLALQQLPVTTSASLYETIWANYLFAAEKSRVREYAEKVLLVLGNGGENLPVDNDPCFFCCQNHFKNFFTEVVCLNPLSTPNGQPSPFIRHALECKWTVLDTELTPQDYHRDLSQLLRKYQKDADYFRWLWLLTGLPLIGILFLKPEEK